VLLVQSEQLRALEVGMELDLVAGGDDLGGLEDGVEMSWEVVGDAD
jgi:hypothetical protein